MEITIKDIEQNLKSLPENLLDQVNDYVAFLKDTVSGEIPEWQKREVLKRKDDLIKNPENAITEEEMSIFLKELENEN